MCTLVASQYHSCMESNSPDYMSRKRNRSFCVIVHIDGAAVTLGRLFSFTTWVKEVTSEIESTPCPPRGMEAKEWRQKMAHLQYMSKITNGVKVHVLCSYSAHLLCISCTQKRGSQILWVIKATPEMSFTVTVTTASTFQGHKRIPKLAYLYDISTLHNNKVCRVR